MCPPQTTYTLDETAAIAGQVVEARSYAGRYDCSEAILPGLAVALHTDGKLRLPRHSDKILGIAPYRAALPAGGYATGDRIAVVRSGQVWCVTGGSAQPTVTALQKPNIMASTTIATDRGKFTGDASSASAGVEIDVAPNGTEAVKNSTGICLVKFEYPSV